MLQQGVRLSQPCVQVLIVFMTGDLTETYYHNLGENGVVKLILVCPSAMYCPLSEFVSFLELLTQWSTWLALFVRTTTI